MNELEKQLVQMHSFDAVNQILNGIELHPLQALDVMKALAHERGIIIYPTGTGKTLLMAAMMKLLLQEDSTRKFIIFVKKDQLIQTPKKLMAATGALIMTSAADKTSFSRLASISPNAYNFLMLTHDCLKQPHFMEFLHRNKGQFSGVIVDEAHELNNTTFAASAEMLQGVVSQFRFCWALTATPITTSLIQLAKLANLVNPKDYPNPKKLVYALQSGRFTLEEDPCFFILRSEEELRGKTSEYNARIHWVSSMPHQMDSAGVRNLPLLFKGPDAVAQVKALRQELLSYRGKRGLVYINQHAVREWVLPWLDECGINYRCINGHTKAAERTQIMHEFNDLKTVDVVILSVTTAIDLDCDYVIFYEFTVYLKQMVGRAHRGLGTKVLDIVYIITSDSSEFSFFMNNIYERSMMIQSILGTKYPELETLGVGVE